MHPAASLLRASVNYQDRQLRDHMMRRFHQDFPHKLPKWDVAQHFGPRAFRDTPELAFQALLFCRNFGVYTVLPAILLTLCKKFTSVCPILTPKSGFF